MLLINNSSVSTSPFANQTCYLESILGVHILSYTIIVDVKAFCSWHACSETMQCVVCRPTNDIITNIPSRDHFGSYRTVLKKTFSNTSDAGGIH